MSKDEMIAEKAKLTIELDTLDREDKYWHDSAELKYKANDAKRINILARIKTLDDNIKNIK